MACFPLLIVKVSMSYFPVYPCSNNYFISPQSRKGRKDNFSFHLPLRGPAEAGCKQRQMKK
jgi:hypothetical protein